MLLVLNFQNIEYELYDRIAVRVAIGEHLDLMANTAEEVKGQTSVEMLGHFIWLTITSVENKKSF